MNDLDRDRANIFPDQTVFLEELDAAGIADAHLIVPGSVVELDGGQCTVTHPEADEATLRPFTAKASYLDEYRAAWRSWLAAERTSWSSGRRDLVSELGAWLEPLMERAPITSAGIAGNVVLEMADGSVCLDFIESESGAWDGEPYVYKITVDRRLVESLVERHVEDWVNSLFLSCRFRVPPRAVQRVRDDVLQGARTGAHRLRRAQLPPQSRRPDEFFERDGWRIERWCPHRQADLTRFGEIRDGVLTCSLHHWQFDLKSGRCLTSDDRHLRCSPVADA